MTVFARRQLTPYNAVKTEKITNGSVQMLC